MNPTKMRKVRLVDHKVALFFAPMILLFTISGTLRTVYLYETHARTVPTPPRWIV